MQVTRVQIEELVKPYGLTYAQIMALIRVETPGHGFKDGKLLIQFEPAWFRKKEPFAPSGKWSVNKVDVQSKEWAAFNSAFSIDPKAAMESTSIGLPQIMGFNYAQCGYMSVGEMWDDFKKGEENQVHAMLRFIHKDSRLSSALKIQNWDKVASIYNGSGYKQLAVKIGREPYDQSLAKEYLKLIA